MLCRRSLIHAVAFFVTMMLVSVNTASTWEKETHKTLNSLAVVQGTAVGGDWPYPVLLDDYVRHLFRWESADGIFWKVGAPGKEKSILEWIVAGAEGEDAFPRYFNHFHDPLEGWEQSGLRMLGTRWYSSLVWAQLPEDGQRCYLPLGIPWPCDRYSWHDARSAYHRGLTAPTKAERSKGLADTFRALGHIMHLVEDAAVPEHTRNDARHGPNAARGTANIETWFDKPENSQDMLTTATPQHFTYDELTALFGIPIDGPHRVPIARLFDTDLYVGTNPERSMDRLMGIAEYSNANFLAGGVTFGAYPYPVFDRGDVYVEGGRTYIRKARDGEAVSHLAYFVDSQSDPRYLLDEKCYRDYAEKLIPRAIQYAAAIPYYFFRAVLLVRNAPGPNPNLYYNILEVHNESGESMKDGILEVYYDHGDGYQHLVATKAVPYLEACVDGNSFECPSTRIELPVDGCGWITVVFRGTLGLEKGAVVFGRSGGCPM